MARYDNSLDLQRAALLLEALALLLPLSRLLACWFITASLRGVLDTVITALSQLWFDIEPITTGQARKLCVVDA
jgi:hypothetical protein